MLRLDAFTLLEAPYSGEATGGEVELGAGAGHGGLGAGG